MKKLSRILILAIVLIISLVPFAFAADMPTGVHMEGEAVIVEATAPPAPQLPAEPITPNTSNIPPPRDMTQLFVAIISLVSVILTTFIAPWLKASRSEKQLINLRERADIAVGAAWDLLKTQPGQERLAYALEVMEKAGYTVDMPGVVDAVKAAWVALKTALANAGINTDGSDRYPSTIQTIELDAASDPQALADAFAKALDTAQTPRSNAT